MRFLGRKWQKIIDETIRFFESVICGNGQTPPIRLLPGNGQNGSRLARWPTLPPRLIDDKTVAKMGHTVVVISSDVGHPLRSLRKSKRTRAKARDKYNI